MKPEWCPQWAWEAANECMTAWPLSAEGRAKIARALLQAEQRGRREGMEEAAKGQTLPDAEFYIGQPVEKFTGEALWEGVVVSTYHTTKGKMRYVVEVQPQGFQMIAVPSQLRAKLDEVQK